MSILFKLCFNKTFICTDPFPRTSLLSIGGISFFFLVSFKVICIVYEKRKINKLNCIKLLFRSM